MPRGVETYFHLFPVDPQGEPRRLHAKALILESGDWVAGMLGSSNFTAAGYGIAPYSHLEVNVAIGAAVGTREAKAISGLIPVRGRVRHRGRGVAGTVR